MGWGATIEVKVGKPPEEKTSKDGVINQIERLERLLKPICPRVRRTKGQTIRG